MPFIALEEIKPRSGFIPLEEVVSTADSSLDYEAFDRKSKPVTDMFGTPIPKIQDDISFTDVAKKGFTSIKDFTKGVGREAYSQAEAVSSLAGGVLTFIPGLSAGASELIKGIAYRGYPNKEDFSAAVKAQHEVMGAIGQPITEKGKKYTEFVAMPFVEFDKGMSAIPKEVFGVEDAEDVGSYMGGLLLASIGARPYVKAGIKQVKLLPGKMKETYWFNRLKGKDQARVFRALRDGDPAVKNAVEALSKGWKEGKGTPEGEAFLGALRRKLDKFEANLKTKPEKITRIHVTPQKIKLLQDKFQKKRLEPEVEKIRKVETPVEKNLLKKLPPEKEIQQVVRDRTINPLIVAEQHLKKGRHKEAIEAAETAKANGSVLQEADGPVTEEVVIQAKQKADEIIAEAKKTVEEIKEPTIANMKELDEAIGINKPTIDAMIQAYKGGSTEILNRPIAVRKVKDGFKVIEGFHRAVAAKRAGVEPPLVILTEKQVSGLNAPQIDALAKKIYKQQIEPQKQGFTPIEEFKLATEEARIVEGRQPQQITDLFTKEQFAEKLSPEEVKAQVTEKPVEKLKGEQELPLKEKIMRTGKPMHQQIFNPEKHSLKDFIAIKGGLNIAKEKGGGYTGELSKIRETKSGAFLVTKGGGLSVDDMRMQAIDQGFLDEWSSPDDFIQALEHDLTTEDRLSRVWSSGKDIEGEIERSALKFYASGTSKISKRIMEMEERKAGGGISGGGKGAMPTPMSDYSGEFKMPEVTRLEKFRAFWEDYNVRAKTLNGEIEKIAGNLMDENLDLYLQKDMLVRLESDAVRRIRNEKREHVLDLTEKGLDVDNVGVLVWAEHAIERNRAMKERLIDIGKEPVDGLSGMTDERAQSIIDKATPAMKTESTKVRKMFDDLLTESVELGLTTQKLADAYRTTYDNYVALFRDMESDLVSGIGGTQGVDIRGPESKRAKGSFRDVHNPIANYYYTKERLRIRALKNEVGKTIIDLTKEYPFLKDLFEIRKTPMRPVGKVTHKAAMDLQFQRELMDYAKSIGLIEFSTEGQVGKLLGYYVGGKRKIVKRLGAGRETATHEVAHFISEILRNKYQFRKEFYRKGKTKEIGKEIHEHSVIKGEGKTRLKSVEEKWANAFSWWMTHRGQAKESMPLFDKRIREIINKHTELKPLLNIRPTPKLEIESITKDVFAEYYPMGPDEIGVKIDGNQFFIKVKDPELAVALKNLNLARIPKFVRHFRLALGVWSSLKTKYRPEFLLTNFERDLGEALINLGVERHLLGKEGKGLRRAIVKDLFTSQRIIGKYVWSQRNKTQTLTPELLAVDEFFKLGGDVGKYWMQDIASTEKTLRKLQDELTGKGIEKFLNPIRKADDLIDTLQSSVELGIRYSTYKQLISRGMSKKRAVQATSDLTVNFSRTGNFGPVLKSAYGFIGPAIQGTSKIARTLATPYGRKHKSKMLGLKLGAAVGGLIMLGYAVRMLSSFADPDGDEQISDYVKNHKIAFSYNGDTYTFWNMPYGYTSFYAMGSNLAEIQLGKKTANEGLRSILETAVDSFSPWGTSIYDFIPTLAKPIFEIDANKGWYKGPIYPAQPFTNTPKPDSEVHFKNTRKSTIFATRFLYKTTGIDIHPDTLKYGFSQWAGGPFEFALESIESGARGMKGEFDPNKTPFVKQFFKHGKADRWAYGTIYKTLEDAWKRPMSSMEKERFYRAIDVGVEEKIFGDKKEDRQKKANGFIRDFLRAQAKITGPIRSEENIKKLKAMPKADRDRLIPTYAEGTRMDLEVDLEE